jgi:hypothetical protein
LIPINVDYRVVGIARVIEVRALGARGSSPGRAAVTCIHASLVESIGHFIFIDIVGVQKNGVQRLFMAAGTAISGPVAPHLKSACRDIDVFRDRKCSSYYR